LDNLLKIATDAHGGLNAWNQFESLRASVSIGGALWDQKQLPGLFNNSRVDLKLRQQQVITHLPDIGERIVFTPDQVSLESDRLWDTARYAHRAAIILRRPVR